MTPAADSASVVSVVVPTCGDRPELLQRALSLILANDWPLHEVVVVDQGASIESGRLVEQLAARDPRVRLVRTTTVGVAHARNLGVSATSGSLIAFTDDDCEPSYNWLRDLVEAFSDDASVGIAFGSVVPAAHDRSSGFVFGYSPPRHARLTGRRAKLRDGGIGGNMVIRRAAYEEVGGFDEMLGYGGHFPSMEDQDLTYRVLAAGFALAHVPEASVVHNGLHDWQDGRPLIRGTYVAIGATYMKYARLGDWTGALLLLNEMRLAVGNLVVNVVSPGRPLGVGRLAGLLVGMYRSFELDVDRRSGLFVKPTAEDRALKCDGTSPVLPHAE